jgi:hypothetical protein
MEEVMPALENKDPTITCKHCGTLIKSDGKGSWVDATDGDGCNSGVHEPSQSSQQFKCGGEEDESTLEVCSRSFM